MVRAENFSLDSDEVSFQEDGCREEEKIVEEKNGNPIR